MLKVNKYKFFNFIILLFLLFYLENIYKNFVFELYEYMGFTYSFNISKYIEAKLLFFLAIIFIHFKVKSKLIYAFLVLFFILLFIPNLIIFEYTNSGRAIIYSILLFLIFLRFSDFIKIRISSSKISENQSLYLIILITIILMLPFIITKGANLNFNVLKFKDIYEVRKNAGHESFFLSSYLYSWLAKIMFPVLLAFSLIKKKYIISVFAITALLYLFLIQAHKSVFFGILVVLFFFLYKDYYKKTSFFLLTLLFAFIITRILTVYGGLYAPESILIRRVFFIPALLNNYYFDFFNDNYLYLSHSIFSEIFQYPYDIRPANLIGLEYFNKAETHANNGFISDGYMNFGLIGVFLYSIIIIIILKFIASLKIDSRYFGVFFIMVFTLISSPFLTSLLTHGILLLLFLFFFVIQNNQSKNE